jgi:hypothetical protein
MVIKDTFIEKITTLNKFQAVRDLFEYDDLKVLMNTSSQTVKVRNDFLGNFIIF